MLRRGLVALRESVYAAALARLPAAVIGDDKSMLMYPAPAAAKASPGSANHNGNGHPRIFIHAAEAAQLRAALGKYPLFDKSVAQAREIVDRAITNPIDVPQPGEAGGYAHERHKQNYREMQAAGLLYQIIGR